MDFVVENKLGLTKGTELEKVVNGQFQGETNETGLYLAMARQAQREGYGEIAEVLKRIAWEEAEHAARFAELNGKISESTKENIAKMLEGEQGANKMKRKAAVDGGDNDLDAANDFFNESAKDEARHAAMLKGLLDRYFAE